ncbi:hypothetical protein [Rhizobium sp. BK376]|uniref:hypothetical protein n=1 Tax=Rhizobium sp. BK376 TaxID=2512149 RepID=UPI00104FDE0C|nr:hypothetical protein [Rhizobium sp. BK376]TCR90977.1 hypothetical protein EV561_103371 [Rhizobium sp. BK376]
MPEHLGEISPGFDQIDFGHRPLMPATAMSPSPGAEAREDSDPEPLSGISARAVFGGSPLSVTISARAVVSLKGTIVSKPKLFDDLDLYFVVCTVGCSDDQSVRSRKARVGAVINSGTINLSTRASSELPVNAVLEAAFI